MTKIVKELREKRLEIWENEPEEVRKSLLNSKGAYGQSFFPALFATEGTRNLHFTIVSFRKVALKETSDLDTMKDLLKSLMDIRVDQTFNWGGMPEIAKHLENVTHNIGAISERGEFIALLEELALYIGRLNYWLDTKMPWHELYNLYEKVKYKKFVS